MPYSSPVLACKNRQVAAVIAMATEGHLLQAHYLLTARYSGNTPHNHFGQSAIVMTILTIAATSVLRKFDPAQNKNSGKDREDFVDCVSEFFPWAHVSINDPRTPAHGKPRRAAEILYTLVRCPLIHSGGMVGTSGAVYEKWLKLKPSHTLPGLASKEENEQTIDDWCALTTLDGQLLMDVQFDHVVVHAKTLYWCARRMIEAFAAKPEAESDIITSFSIKA